MSKQQNTTNFRRSPNEALVVKKRVKGRWLQFFAVVLLISQLFVSSLLPAYQVFAETTDASTTTSTAPATASSQTKVPTAETTEPPAATEESKEAVDMEQVKAKLLQTISQFGDIKGTTITVTDKKITIELSALISEHAEEIKTAITPLIPEGYAAELTAKQELAQLTSLDQLTDADLASPIEVTWSHSEGAATYTGTKVVPKSFSIALKSTADGRTITWKKGDVITLPNLIYTGAYGTVELQPSFVKTTIAGMGYVEGNTITITTNDNGAAPLIQFSNIKAGNFEELPPRSFTTATPAKASFLGSSLSFTIIDQVTEWGDPIGEPIDEPEGELPTDFPDMSFKYLPKVSGENDVSMTAGATYNDSFDLMRYINRVNDEEAGNYTNLTKEPTMGKLADTTGNIYMVNTYPNTDGKILDVIGNSLYAWPGSGVLTGMTPDGKQAMIGGDTSKTALEVATKPHIFQPGTTSAEMKAALAVGEIGYSKQADGTIISMVNMGDYSEDGNHLSYRNVINPTRMWTQMITNQHAQPADGFDGSAYQAKMVEADGATTPPLFEALFYSTIIVEDPTDIVTRYKLVSTIEGEEGPIPGIEPQSQTLKMNPVVVNTDNLAALKIAYRSGDTVVAPTKTIYAEPNTTFNSYLEENPSENLFPESFTVGPIIYKLKEQPATKDFGAIGSTETITVEYEPQAMIQLDYQSNGKTIAPSKLIYGGEQTPLADYLTNHVNDKLLPEEIKDGTMIYRLKPFDATPHKFGDGGTLTHVVVEYEPRAMIQLNYESEGETIAPPKLIYADPETLLTDYVKDHPTENLFPTEIKNGTSTYRLKDFDATPYQFGDGGSLTPVTVEYVKASDLGFWTPREDDNLAKNTGTYGDPGLESYVYSKDPFLDHITTGDPLAEENKVAVLAKGIYGPDAKTGVKWYISTDGVLHLGSGITNNMNTSLFPNPETGLSGVNKAPAVSPWYQYKGQFTKVSIDGKVNLNYGSNFLFSTLTQVTSYVGLENLDFTFSASITLDGMFHSNHALTEMSGEETWDLSKAINTQRMFSNVQALTSLDGTNWGMEKVSTTNSMFLNTLQLTEIKGIDTWSMASNRTTSQMFYNARSLKSLDLSKWDTSQVTEMSSMFYTTSALAYLNTSNWNTSKVTNMSWMFSGAKVLPSLDTSSWDTGLVKDMSYMFQGANALKTIDTSHWNTGNVTNMESMFRSTYVLPTLDTSNWNTGNVTNMNRMFYSAYALTSLDASSWDTSKVTNMQAMLASANALKEIRLGTQFITTQVITAETPGQLKLPTETSIYLWRNVADGSLNLPLGDGTLAIPLGQEYTGTFESGTNVADTYVLTGKVGAKIDYTDLSTEPNQVAATDYLSGLVGNTVSYDVLDPWQADLLKDIPYVYAGEGMSAFNYTPDPLSVTLTVDNTDNKVIPMKKIAEVTKLPTAMPEAIPETTPAKGIFGDVEWYIDLGGTLHFGEGTFGDMETLTESPWKDYNDLIKTISFEGSVKANTSMSHLFANLTNVTAISGLAKVDVSATENMNGTFSNMTSLPVLDFSGWQTPNVTNMLNMLSGDTSLKEVTFDSGFVTPQVMTAETAGQLELPNDTKTIKWQNVAEGTVTKPLGEEFIGAYKSGTNVPDTYVLVNDTVTPNFPNTGSNLRLIALISASGMILFGLLGASWYKRRQNIE